MSRSPRDREAGGAGRSPRSADRSRFRTTLADPSRFVCPALSLSLSPSLALRSDVKIEDILSVNHGLKKDAILEGQTILLPSSKLSVRDREILDGVKGKGKYRAYPARKGEKIEDIIGKRGIKMAEVEKLNEGVDLASLQGELDPARGSDFPSTFHQRRELTLFFGCCCSLPSDQAPAKQVYREGEGDAVSSLPLSLARPSGPADAGEGGWVAWKTCESPTGPRRRRDP